MVSYCLQFVESFGNQQLQLPFDSKSRLKLAVKYLLLATQLSKMNRDLYFNSQAMTSSDPGYSFTACPEPLENLLLAISSSSVFGLDANSRPSNQTSSNADSNAPDASKAKAKPALSKKTSEPIPNTSQPGKPTIRDAILLLSSLTRETIPFCLDSIEYSLQSDLRDMIRSNFEPIRKKYFITSLPTLEEEITIPESSITCLWRPTSEVLSNQDNQLDKSKEDTSPTCLFSNVIGYFLLAPVKDQASGALLTASSEPFLTKSLLSRSHLMEYELYFRRFKEKLLRSVNQSPGQMKTLHEMKSVPLNVLQQEMGEKIRGLFYLLRGIESPSKKDLGLLRIQEIKEESGEGGIKGYQIYVSDTKVCDMNFNGEMLDSLIAIVTKDRVCATMACDRSVLLFLWAALRL